MVNPNPNEQTFAEKYKSIEHDDEQDLLFTPEWPQSELNNTPNKLLKMEKEWNETFKDLLEK